MDFCVCYTLNSNKGIMRTRLFKFISGLLIFILTSFFWTDANWAGTDACLRVLSSIERGRYFTFGQTHDVCDGVIKTEVVFSAADRRSAEGWVVEMDPRRVVFDVLVDPDMVGYDFQRFAITRQLAANLGKEYKELPGDTIPHLKSGLPPRQREKLVLIGPLTQGGFWGANSMVVSRGTLIKKTAPGLFQTEVMQPNGEFYFFVLDKGKSGVRKVRVEHGVPQEDVSDIDMAFVGPPLIYRGENVSDLIRFPKTDDGALAPLLDGCDVNWSPGETATSFIAWGHNRKTGAVFYFPMVRRGNRKIDGVLCTEMIHAVRRYAKLRGMDMRDLDVILGPGGVDCNVDLKGELLIPTDPRSATALDYPEGRHLGTVVFVYEGTESPPPTGMEIEKTAIESSRAI